MDFKKTTIRLVFLNICFFSCNQREQNASGAKLKLPVLDNREVGYKIDSLRIGEFNVCDSVNATKFLKYPLKIDTLNYEEDEWYGYYYSLDDIKKKWVLLESRGVGSMKVSKISTNSEVFKTAERISIGTSLDELLKTKIIYDVILEDGEVLLYLRESKSYVIFENLLKVNFEKFENEHYKNVDERNFLPMFNKEAIIKEIFILSYCP